MLWEDEIAELLPQKYQSTDINCYMKLSEITDTFTLKLPRSDKSFEDGHLT